jgi:transcriptional regulator with GAF, ATPase, and Fis domain
VDTEGMVALATEFDGLAARIDGDGGRASSLHRVVELAVRHVEGCSWASITDLRKEKGRSLASSAALAGQLDSMQFDVGEGPSLQAIAENTSCLMFDVADETRWPRFTALAAAETPMRCVLAIRLPGEESAALSLYADHSDAFDDAAVAMATLLASRAAGLVLLSEVEERTQNLRTALQSNRQIGMAMGILMAHHKITEQAAFALLRAASQNLHRKLRDIAIDVTQTGTLPEYAAVQRSTARLGSARSTLGARCQGQASPGVTPATRPTAI